MADSKIDWTNACLNPVTGCTKMSSGCRNCYAEKMTRRLQAMKQKKYRKGFDVVVCHPDTLTPLLYKKPKKIFVNSMSDLFHEDVPFKFIQDVLHFCETEKKHTFQILTKRSERLAIFSPELVWPDNVWMGVSVENQASMFRMEHLRKCGARVKFVSAEPLISRLPDFDPTGLDWVIAGAESGARNKVREMKLDWVREIRDACIAANVPFFFKQLRSPVTDRMVHMPELDGRQWKEMPKCS